MCQVDFSKENFLFTFSFEITEKKTRDTIFLKTTFLLLLFQVSSFALHRLQYEERFFDHFIYCVIPPWNKNISKWWIHLLKRKIISFPCFNNYISHYSSSRKRKKQNHASSLILKMHSRSRDLWFMFAVMQWRIERTEI